MSRKESFSSFVASILESDFFGGGRQTSMWMQEMEQSSSRSRTRWAGVFWGMEETQGSSLEALQLVASTTQLPKKISGWRSAQS